MAVAFAILAVGWALDHWGVGVERVAAAAPSPGRPLVERSDGYVSSDACQSCHPDEYDSWRRSYHSSMTQEPTRETVKAPFDGEQLHYVYDYALASEGDDFWITTNNPDWAEPGESLPVTRRVGLVTGSHHQQLYWFERRGTRAVGRFQFFWRLRDERWVPFNSAVLIPPTPLTEAGTTWSTTCIRCHTTHGRPRIDFDDPMKMDSRVAELGIACEACHGPGAEHVEANRGVVARYLRYLGLGSGDDDTIVEPRKLEQSRALDVCGQCHAVQLFGTHARVAEWSESGSPYRPGGRLVDYRHVLHPSDERTLGGLGRRAIEDDPGFIEDRFWSDGVAKVSGREWHGVKDSPCYADPEFTCSSCHRMHQDTDDERPSVDWADDQEAADRLGDAACTGCHPAIAAREALEAHTHHPASSTGSRCGNCHMPNTAYGLLKGTRSHRIENPSVATQLETGRPNACNLCHLDRPLEWTARTLEQWYGTPQPPLPDPEHRRTAEGALQALRGDAGQRALAAWHFGWEAAQQASQSEQWAAPVLLELADDPYEAVRYIAVQSLRSLPGEAAVELDYLAGPTEQGERKQEALDAWRAPADGARGVRARTLVTNEGDSMRARVAELLQQRDHRRVFRGE